jgi:hypothetical protein
MSRPFTSARAAALALLNSDARRSGSFLGQCVVDPTPLSAAQMDWIQSLLERATLPPLQEVV